MTFQSACQAILASQKANEYARAYARAGIDGSCPDGAHQRVQALYILNNIGSWREPEAKEVRQFLKDFSK